MNLEKLVNDCLQKHRSDSQRHSRRYPPGPQKMCYSRQISVEKPTHKKYCSFEQIDPDINRYQPEIHQLPKSIYHPSSKTQCSREEIVERLMIDRRDKEALWAKQKYVKQEQQFKSECTFRPQINENSKKIMKTECTEHYRSTQDRDPFDRLYNQGMNKIRLSESLSIANKIENKQNHSFQPETNYKKVLNSQTTMLPIYQRIQQIMKEKRNYLNNLQDKNSEKQMRDKPTISEKTKKIVENKQEFKKSILHRINNYIIEERERKKINEELRDRKMTEDCTFKPEVNCSGILLDNFQKRQEEYLQKLNQKLTSRIREEEDKNFKPQINRISDLLVMKERAEETWEDKVNRLAYQQGGKQEKIIQIEQQIYRECTFEPEINLISKSLGEQSRKVSHSCAKHCCDNMQQKEEHFQFKPKINKISDYLVKMKRESGQNGAITKRSNIDHLKMEAEYKEMKECTFQPKINRKDKTSRSKTQQTVEKIAGFDAYNQKINKIQLKREQEKRREEEVFNLQKKYQYRKSTKPQEFKLSQGINHKASIRLQAEKKFEQVCTFKPRISNMR